MFKSTNGTQPIAKAPSLSRREFFKGSAAALVIGAYLPMLVGKRAQAHNHNATALTANAFVRVDNQGLVTILSKHIEFGQGVFTGLATLVAEEMDADWSQMRAEHAPADNSQYQNLFFGVQGTGGSTAIANSYQQMRQAGAAARYLLVNAAAKEWGVAPTEIQIQQGRITHRSTGKQAGFGDFVSLASTIKLPEQEMPLKSPDNFILIGQSLPKLDTDVKSNGAAVYTEDLHLDEMVAAIVSHAPNFGATIKRIDSSAATQSHGVLSVKQIANDRVAVYAKTTFDAIRGSRLLQIEWDNTHAEMRSSETLKSEFKKAVSSKGVSVAERGDAEKIIAADEDKLDVEMVFPYLAHAPMEPLDAVVHFQGNKVEAWFGSQLPTVDQGAIAQVFGISPNNVSIEVMLSGGSFGRRAQPDAGLAVEAALVAKAYDKQVPVKTVWTREDDIRGGRYRPMAVHKIAASLDDNGDISAWKHNVAVQSILKGSPFEGMMQNGIDPSSIEGIPDMPYPITHFSLQLHDMEVGVPVLWWRSVGHTHTAYAVETMIDTLLERAERDPIQGRLALMKNHPRETGVLKAVDKMVKKAGPVAEGRARGVAVVKSFGSYVAQIAEVSNLNNMPKVHKVWCAVDCGIALNPNVIKAQIEGGLGYGLDAMLYGEVTLNDDGQVAQSNFHDYQVMRIQDMPDVETMIVSSSEAPTGIGEPGTPPIAPAVSNAWRRLTGQFVTELPFVKGTKTA